LAQWGHVIEEYSYSIIGEFFFPKIKDPLGSSLENKEWLFVVITKIVDSISNNFFMTSLVL